MSEIVDTGLLKGETFKGRHIVCGCPDPDTHMWVRVDPPEPATPVMASSDRAADAIGHFEEAPSGITTHFWRRVVSHHDPERAAECRQAGGRCAYDAAMESTDA